MIIFVKTQRHNGKVERSHRNNQKRFYGWLSFYSLKDLSKRPHTPHPNAHTSDEIKHIEDLLRMNPYIGLSELYGKLKRNYSYTRHPASLFRFLRKKGIYVTPEATKPKYEPKPYDTPKAPGEKL